MAPTATPTVPGSEGGGPSVGGPWPGRPIYSFPIGETGGLIGVAHGIAYTLSSNGTVIANPSDFSKVRYLLRAVTIDGRIAPGWPEAGIPGVGFPVDLLLGSDGTLYVAFVPMTLFTAKAPTPFRLTVTAFDPQGRVRAGWPYTGPAVFHVLNRPFLIKRPGGGVCVKDTVPGATTTEPRMEIRCLDLDGRTAKGWPYRSGRFLSAVAAGPDGTIYVEERKVPHTIGDLKTIVALSQDGRPRSGWTAPELFAVETSQMIAGPGGIVYLVVGGSFSSASIQPIGPDGDPRYDWTAHFDDGLAAAAPLTMPDTTSIAPDGTVHVAASLVGVSPGPYHAEVLAFTPDGLLRPGWPITVDQVEVAALTSPDGSVWVWSGDGVLDPGKPSTLEVANADGTIRPGWPVEAMTFTGLTFDEAGIGYVSVHMDGRDVLEAISP